MFRPSSNILFRLAGLILILSLASCKSKKQAASEKNTDDALSYQRQIAFGENYINGCAARMKSNLEDAMKLFLECSKIDPDNIPVKYELAIVYRMMGVNDQALAYAKICAQADPKNEWYQILLIQSYHSLKQFNNAIKVREQLVKNFPDRMEFKEDLAYEYQLLGQFEDSKAHFDKALRIYNELEKVYGINEQLSLQKSRLLKNQKRQKEAEDELLKLVASNPSETRYYSYLADFYIEMNDLQKAKEMYDKILSLEPNNPVVNLALHDYYSAQGKMTEAMGHLKKAFLNPDLDVATKANIISSFYENAVRRPDGEFFRENGLDLARIMVQVHPQTSEANAAMGDFLKLENKIGEAVQYYYKAATKEKSNSAVWENLLTLENKLLMYDSLEKHSSAAIEIFPNIPRAYLYNGAANIHLKNYKKAIRSLKDGLEFVVDNKIMMVAFYEHLGEAYYYNHDYDQSDKAFEDALKVDSDKKEVLNRYAVYLSERKANLDKAEKLAKKAVDLDPTNYHYMDTYGWILYQQKRYAEAEPWLQNAAKAGQKNAAVMEHYGDVLFKLNKTKEALEYWEKAKQAGGNSESLLKKIKEKKLND